MGFSKKRSALFVGDVSNRTATDRTHEVSRIAPINYAIRMKIVENEKQRNWYVSSYTANQSE